MLVNTLGRQLNKIGLIFLLGAITACTGSGGVRISGLQLQPFISVVAAVTDASNRYNPMSIRDDREFMGVVVYREGYYYYTAAAGVAGSDQISITLPPAHFGEVVALWHTHGREHVDHVYFSSHDTALARKLKLPFYLADHSGILKVFRPEDPVMNDFQRRRGGLVRNLGIASGRPVYNSDGTNVLVNR